VEESALRSDAWARVQNALIPNGIGLQGLPPELRQLFDSFVEREIASIARRAQRDALKRELFQLSLQIGSIRSQQQFTADQDRLLHLIPRLQLRDLSGSKLADSTAALSQVLASYAAPTFELRDPVGFTVFRSQVAAGAELVTTSMNITKRYEETLANFGQLARAVANGVGAAQFELPVSQRRTLVVAVPRAAGPGHPAWSGPWKTVSPTTAKSFWDRAFDANGSLQEASVTLSPADIYTGPGGVSRLGCLDLAPVVRHVGLYFDTGSDTPVLGPLGMEIIGIAAVTSPVWFPLTGHTMPFEASDPLGIPIRAAALNGNVANVLDDGLGHPINFGIWPADLGAGAGISPFTSFRFDMRAFAPPFASQSVQDTLSHTRALLMMFDVERRTSNLNAWVPGVCDLP
jgi:hypothetical protein